MFKDLAKCKYEVNEVWVMGMNLRQRRRTRDQTQATILTDCGHSFYGPFFFVLNHVACSIRIKSIVNFKIFIGAIPADSALAAIFVIGWLPIAHYDTTLLTWREAPH